MSSSISNCPNCVVERAKDSLNTYDYAHAYGCDPGYPVGLIRSLVAEVERLRAEVAACRVGLANADVLLAEAARQYDELVDAVMGDEQ